MAHSEFKFSGKKTLLSAGSYTWKSPSNIALIKYWGKHGIQLPKNPSLSFTLSKCATETTLEFEPKKKATQEVDFQVIFEGKPAEHFLSKIELFFNKIIDYAPFLRDYKFKILTENTFPHSSGIASSASGMSALALCILSMEHALSKSISEEYFFEKAGFLARLGSGSAARSISGPIMVWGKHPSVKNSADEFAVRPNFKLHPIFKKFQNTILLVQKGKKEVSSSKGHELMIGHPYAKNRFDQAFVNMELLIDTLENGNLDEFIKIVESEALTLHAMMMTSTPYFILMKPNTLEIIQRVWAHRKETGSKVCFTLDAGANIHLLYPKAEQKKIKKFIKNELRSFCENGEYICDQIGNGSKEKS